MRISAHGRNKDRGKELSQLCAVTFLCGDIRQPFPYSHPISDIAAREASPHNGPGGSDIDYILHCAAVTQSAVMTAAPADVIETAADGTRHMLQLARERNSRSVVYLSSAEVYGQTEKTTVSENDLGYLDLTAPRSSYPGSKRFCELLCAAYYTQYKTPVKIARLAQTFGAGTPNDDTRVFAQFARSLIDNRDIVLHTPGKSRGNYCYISDTVRGLLTVLLKGKNGEVFNINNPAASATIREMAEQAANAVPGKKINITVDIPQDIQQYGYAPDAGYTLGIEKLTALGWAPRYGLGEMFKRMTADWRETNG
jgi:nucleoside-diphosphate-sugar epimerase